MDSLKKIYPTAKLKSLPAEKQQAIVDYLEGDGEDAKAHSLKAAISWLRADGINTSSASLSEFRSWFLLRQILARNEQTAMETVAECKDKGWLKTAEEEQAAGQIFFTRLAMQQGDVKAWFLTQRLALQKNQLALDRGKIEILTCEKFLAWFKDKKARDIAESNISTPDKIAQLRQTYFADVDQLEQAGEVELPE